MCILMNTFSLNPLWITVCQWFLDLCDYSSWVACFYQINANPLILKNLRSTTNLTKIFPLNGSLIKCGQIKYTKSFCGLRGGGSGEKTDCLFYSLIPGYDLSWLTSFQHSCPVDLAPSPHTTAHCQLYVSHSLHALNLAGYDQREDPLTRAWTRKPR